MSTKIYVITELSFEYNDEIYYTGEAEGGEPVEAYSSKESADKACNLKTKDWVELLLTDSRYDDISSYAYNLDSLLDVYKFSDLTGVEIKTLEDAWEHSWSGNKETILTQLLRDHLDATVESLHIRPFRVTEINLK
jgi:hypothetical protein